MAVRQLDGADVEVLLLDRDLYNTFQPQLYQVATGGLNPGDVTYALRAFAAGGDRGAQPLAPGCFTTLDPGAEQFSSLTRR